MPRMSPIALAIALMLGGSASFALMNIVIRLLSPEMASTQMVFVRNLFSLTIVFGWSLCLHRRWPRYVTSRIKSHFWRASVGFVAMELWFYSVTIMPITLATALSFTTPIFSTIFAIVFLREKAGIRRWSAIIAGFIGMLIILRPGTDAADAKALFVIGSSAMMAVAAVLVKTLTRTEPPETIVFYMALFMIPWSAGPALLHWQPVTSHQLFLVFLVALFSTIAHLLVARAYLRADMVVLMPFDFTRLVFTAALAYPIFGEWIDGPTLLGAGIIVTSTVYIARREAYLRMLQAKAS